MPTRGIAIRHRVLGMLGLLSMITYLDRVCFGSVAPLIKTEFDLSDTQKGLLFGAFGLAYAAFEVPSGWLGDRFGPKRTLTRIVLWWSTFTVLTGLIWPTPAAPLLGFALLLAVRFLFGMGEAGAYPNIARALHNWLPFRERGFGQGVIWMCGRLAGGLTPFLVVQLFVWFSHPGTSEVNWRPVFWIFGGLGAAWCLFFVRWFVDRPEDHAGISTEELQLIAGDRPPYAGDERRVPWRAMIKSANLWSLCLMYFCSSYGWYFNITYLPGFLKERFHVDGHSLRYSLMAGAPLLVGSLACLLGGFLTDGLVRYSGNRKWGRRGAGVLGHGLCAGFYFLAAYAQSLELFVVAITLAAFWNDLTMGSSWSVCQDIGGPHTGVVAGCMNTIGNLGGAAAGVITGIVLDVTKEPNSQDWNELGWHINLLSFALVYVVAVIFWLRIDAKEPIAPVA